MKDINPDIFDDTNAASEELREQLLSAPMASLTKHPSSSKAKALAARLVGCVEDHEREHGLRKRARRTSAKVTLATAVGAFLGDLLACAWGGSKGGWCYRSLNRDSFIDDRIQYRQFKAAAEAMEATGLLERRRPYRGAVARSH